MKDQTAPVPYFLRPNELQTKLNEKMAELVPELDSPLVRAPMVRNKWYKPSEILGSGEPCFIPANTRREVDVPDYIWMPHRKGQPAGYYHLRTQEAYIQIYHLIRQQRAPLHKRLFQKRSTSSRDDMKLHQELLDLIQLRLCSDVPNDVHAARMRLQNVQSQGGKAAAFGKASYLPTATTAVLLGLTTG